MMQRALNRRDFKTLALAAIGGALEYYDFIVFVFLAALIGKLFFPPDTPDWLQLLQTFGIFAAGYLARPLGGIVMAHFGDLFGRKRMFTLGIFMMSIPTLLTGLLPTYDSIGIAAPLTLLLLRLIQGAAVGGEVPGAWVFVAEHVPPRHVGFACGTLTSGLSVGILLGSLVAAGVNTFFSTADVIAYAWRIPFLVGGVFGFMGVYLRLYLEETPVFEELKRNRKLAEELPLKAVIREYRPAIVVSVLLTWLLTAALVVVILMTPTLLQKQHRISPAVALQASSLATFFLTIGCTAFGLLIDRIGAGKTFILGSLCLLGSTLLFYFSLDTAPELLFPTYALAGFCVGIAGAVPYVMVNAFPPKVRFTGLSSSYNLAYAIFGGLTPVFVTLIMKTQPMAPAYYVAAVCLLGIAVGIFLLRNDVHIADKSTKQASGVAA
ncbi:Major facilitator transporter [Georgfuchsia toluolica]|uniref:Major facilitator transporter n=1 Tax=Georgfuchsia toluolica TaxID=424218 RepID=A0A916J3J2_9PROT|nr:MFS transporter [Georgfuchsia toluolica]CAG4883323.1 Major facilitator transporter [Georgfuchsia toluolica]